MQQTPSSACSLALGSNQLSFAGCRSLQPSLDADYNLLYTVTASAGQPTVLHGAIDAASLGWPTFWAGFGIPARPGHMLGSSAIIVQSCSTCASGSFLGSHCCNTCAAQPIRVMLTEHQPLLSLVYNWQCEKNDCTCLRCLHLCLTYHKHIASCQ